MIEKKPKIQDSEINKMEDQFDAIDKNIKNLTLDKMNEAPKEETEGPKIARADIDKMPEHYLKPSRVIMSGQKFNEAFREAYEFDKQYVQFIAENNESGDMIEIWTRPYGGMPAEFWQVPVGKAVWGPRHLAEQIRKRSYHRLSMENRPTQSDGVGQYYGTFTVDKVIQRLDARPVSSRKSIFMGAQGF